MTFANNELWYLFLLIPFLVLFFWLAWRSKQKAMRLYADQAMHQSLMPQVSRLRPWLKFILLMFASIFLILGIMGPQFGIKRQEVKRQGVELMIALDVSRSMDAEDITPSRLQSARMAISRLIDKLDGDRIGMVIFAGEAYTQVPITTDYGAMRMFLQSVNTNFVPTQGTAIAKAVELATKSFSESTVAGKGIIVITDGEDHEGETMEAVKKAVEKGVIVHTIGMASLQGAPIPTGRSSSDFKKDKSGQVVISRLNEPILAQIAQAGRGMYMRATNSRLDLEPLLDELEKMQTEEYASDEYKYEYQFQYFIAVALFFLLLDVIILERRNPIFANLNLFGDKK